jgi:cytochrome c-type biogenesis protein CcmH/NrfG
MRRQTRWVFAVLAVVFAASFVFLGVGSGSSALTDILNGNIHLFGGSSGPSVKSLQKKVAKDPTNAKLRLQLAQLLVQKNQTDDAVVAYKNYLKLKPGNTDGLQGLATVYQTKITELQSEIQTPPTPALASLNSFQPVAQNVVLGAALASLQPPELSITSLQQGESDLFQKQLAGVILKHVGIYRTLAAKTPGDSSAFLQIAATASQDGAVTVAIATYQEFLKKYPTDPLVPDVKRQIKSLKKSLTSGQSSSSGATGQTG